jgi:hypothetical protein
LVSTVEAEWFAPAAQPTILLDHRPLLASWNASGHPDQVLLRAYLRTVESQLAESLQRAVGPQSLRLDVGLPHGAPLLENRDLDNYLYPLAAHLQKATGVTLTSVLGTKGHAGNSFTALENSRPAEPPDDVITVRTTASATTKAYKEQIRDQLGHARELPAGPVDLGVAFVVGPRRNWLNLWKPTIDALGALLGIDGARPWHPRDGRITRLALHCTVDPAMGYDVGIAIHARPAAPANEDDAG